MKFLSLVIVSITFSIVPVLSYAQQAQQIKAQEEFKKLERDFGGKIGVYAIDTNNNQIITYRADERFPIQSTFKLIGVSALLMKSVDNQNLLSKKIYYSKDDMVSWHPITGQFINSGMTLEALSEATMSYSDNPAINLIMKEIGGLKSVTDFANSIGNDSFNLESYETNLNSNPKEKRDTATPKDMAISLQKLTLGDILPKSQRTKLVTWMKNNTTSYKRMRASAPGGWIVADKTGSGSYGIANDIGIMWSPGCKPLVLAIYTVKNEKNAKIRDDIIASTTKIILDDFSKNNQCLNPLLS